MADVRTNQYSTEDPEQDNLSGDGQSLSGESDGSSGQSGGSGPMEPVAGQPSGMVTESRESGGYDPAKYSGLDVSDEVRQLFEMISAYEPLNMECETAFKPFIPDYIPAIGDIDAFIKIPRPDDVEDNLGLTILDEPSGKQSDPTVLGLQMKATSKDASYGKTGSTVLKRITRADFNTKEIDDWINSIRSVHGAKPATTVHYTKPMPEIDMLMQEWPTEVEDLLRHVDLPGADSAISLEQYSDTACALMDIPVYKSRIQSLHVLFTLYSEFKNSQHFKTIEEAGEPSQLAAPVTETADRLVL